MLPSEGAAVVGLATALWATTPAVGAVSCGAAHGRGLRRRCRRSDLVGETIERCREVPRQPSAASEAKQQRVEWGRRIDRRAECDRAAGGSILDPPSDRCQRAASDPCSAHDRVRRRSWQELGGRRAPYGKRPSQPHDRVGAEVRPAVERQHLHRAGRQPDVVLEVAQESKDLPGRGGYRLRGDDRLPSAAHERGHGVNSGLCDSVHLSLAAPQRTGGRTVAAPGEAERSDAGAIARSSRRRRWCIRSLGPLGVRAAPISRGWLSCRSESGSASGSAGQEHPRQRDCRRHRSAGDSSGYRPAGIRAARVGRMRQKKEWLPGPRHARSRRRWSDGVDLSLRRSRQGRLPPRSQAEESPPIRRQTAPGRGP